ncbi:uncharacterized protein C8Q71DRAFT_268795 [Rhodofomes roseus]|uniref:Uncharacterized protein n=1 Tax=Rhodofomes roseus TaxID=34475 RepID=A0ABQ8K5M4_9APHY|nr:uncharacterized protein C8Q71DRAFT_268795 [Rhodofomes roseus]KAH9832258.1 hypothetical protein C8Q71DRAFT_268795 [Rhodofomes roseus]
MLSTSRLATGRTKLVPHAIARFDLAARRVAGRRIAQRFQSTPSVSQSVSSQSSAGTHIAAGVAGGAVVVLGGYAWYHFSGAKTAVNAAKQAHGYYEDTKRSIAENAPKNPNEVIEFLRKTAKTYVGVIPGASSYVDSTFDALGELHATHGEEVEKILQQGYDEIRQILQDGKSGADMQTGLKVMEVLQRSSSQLEEVGKRAGQDAFQKLGERYPELKEKLGGKYDELRKAAEKNGPEAKRIYEETTKQIGKIFSSGFSPDKLNEAQELVRSKASEISEAAGGTSQEAWDKVLKEATPYLDKLPDIRKLVEDNASAFMAAGLSQGGAAQEVLARVKEAAEGGAAKNKEKLKELKDFVQAKADEARQRGEKGSQGGLQSLQEWIRGMPGGEEALKKVPDVNVEALMQVAQSRGDDAKKLMGETYEDILKVLQEKAKKAEKIAAEGKEEAKQKSS